MIEQLSIIENIHYWSITVVSVIQKDEYLFLVQGGELCSGCFLTGVEDDVRADGVFPDESAFGNILLGVETKSHIRFLYFILNIEAIVTIVHLIKI